MSEAANVQRDIGTELKGLRLHGMANAWADLMEQGGSSDLASSRWLVEHLLQAEEVNRHMRSIAHQTKAARFPLHRDLGGFDFEVSPVDKALILKLADLSFTQDAQRRCGSTRRSIWSMRWSRRRHKAKLVALR